MNPLSALPLPAPFLYLEAIHLSYQNNELLLSIRPKLCLATHTAQDSQSSPPFGVDQGLMVERSPSRLCGLEVNQDLKTCDGEKI